MSSWAQFWRWFFHLPDPPPVIGFTRGLRRELDALEPGESLRLRTPDGEEFTIMHSDDFTHIARLANLQERPVPMKLEHP